MLVSFGLLMLFAITQTARMVTTVQLEHEYGVPQGWTQLLSGSNPDTITIPITYFDQRSDSCSLPLAQRQWEWTRCRIYGQLEQGLVQNRLGPDGRPVPTAATAAQAAGRRPENRGMWGANFRQWFNQVEGRSLQVDGRTITFERVGDANIYQWGGPDFFPLNDIRFSDGDYTNALGHNFHFTAMASFPFEVQADGRERWEFLGDDDVWVFINGQLVLDIGGLHEALHGWFIINEDGTLTTYVEGVGHGHINLGLKAGDIAHLSFFYAERSTNDANARITIRYMMWPIRAEATIKAETIDNRAIRYISSITNRDPANPLDVTHIASFLNEGNKFDKDGLGFLPLQNGNLYYTLTPDDESSWRPVNISAPHSSDQGHQLETPVRLTSYGSPGDTAYFAFHVAPDQAEGYYYNSITYLTSLNGASSLARASDYARFENIEVDTSNTPTTPPRVPDWGDVDDGYLDPLGEANEVPAGNANNNHYGDLFAPDTGIANVAAIILSQWFLLGTLLVFGISFSVWYPNRMY